MSSKAIAALQFDVSTSKRAQQDTFEFALDAPGIVQVTNTAYDDEEPENHSYRVNIEIEDENGVPAACECPADTYHAGACKYRVAVAIRLPVLAAATVRNPDRDDDAQPQEADIDDVCQFGDDRCDGPEADGLPCFDCYMAAGLDHYPEDAAVAGPEIENTNWNGGGD